MDVLSCTRPNDAVILNLPCRTMYPYPTHVAIYCFETKVAFDVHVDDAVVVAADAANGQTQKVSACCGYCRWNFQNE